MDLFDPSRPAGSTTSMGVSKPLSTPPAETTSTVTPAMTTVSSPPTSSKLPVCQVYFRVHPFFQVFRGHTIFMLWAEGEWVERGSQLPMYPVSEDTFKDFAIFSKCAAEFV